jgi:hypothetical protein
LDWQIIVLAPQGGNALRLLARRHEFEAGLITLAVHSSLNAVGFLAAVSVVLADGRHPVQCRVCLPP